LACPVSSVTLPAASAWIVLSSPRGWLELGCIIFSQYRLFGMIPGVLGDAWVAMALGEKEEAKKIIDALPKQHPFEIRYTKVE